MSSLNIKNLTNQAILQNMFKSQQPAGNDTSRMLEGLLKKANPLQDYVSISDEALKKLNDAREEWAKNQTKDKKSASQENGQNEEIPISEVMRDTSRLVRFVDVKPMESTEEFSSFVSQKISDLLDYKGLQLKEGEEFTFTIENNYIKVSGLDDKNKQSEIEKALNKMHATRDNTYGITISALETTYQLSTDYAKGADSFNEALRRASQIGQKDMVGDMSKYTGGIAVDWSKLSKDENGKVHGLPKELEWAFEKYHDDLAPTDAVNMRAIMIAKPIHLLLDAGYANVPSMGQSDMTFSFSSKGLTVR